MAVVNSVCGHRHILDVVKVDEFDQKFDKGIYQELDYDLPIYLSVTPTGLTMNLPWGLNKVF